MTNTPAFPQIDLKDAYGTLVPDRQSGMSLRDYFAAKAMQGIWSNATTLSQMIGPVRRCLGSEAAWIASVAYEMADAMLKERSDD